MQADAADFPAEVTQAADLALESKGHGVLILDLRGISTATDYFVLASGTSDVQVKAIAEHVVDELKKGDVQGLLCMHNGEKVRTRSRLRWGKGLRSLLGSLLREKSPD